MSAFQKILLREQKDLQNGYAKIILQNGYTKIILQNGYTKLWTQIKYLQK